MLTVQSADKDFEQQNFHILPIGMQDGITAQGNRLELSYLPHDAELLLLGVHSTEMKFFVFTNTCVQICIAALFIISEDWEWSRCPSRVSV